MTDSMKKLRKFSQHFGKTFTLEKTSSGIVGFYTSQEFESYCKKKKKVGKCQANLLIGTSINLLPKDLGTKIQLWRYAQKYSLKK